MINLFTVNPVEKESALEISYYIPTLDCKSQYSNLYIFQVRKTFIIYWSEDVHAKIDFLIIILANMLLTFT